MSGGEMQALKINQQISADGYLHIKIPRDFSAKRVEVIILPLAETPGPSPSTTIKEQVAEWNIDYETSEASHGQTVHTFELLDLESGAEDPSKWK
jgi:hypothetical protein